MMINRHRNHHNCSTGTVLIPCLTHFQAKLFESRAELELLRNLNVWDYVKLEFENITKEVNINIKKAKHIRRYNYTTEQNLEPIEGALEGLQESLVAYEEAVKRANLNGA
jgi:hypothetical protein